jgi:UDP-glucose 4-epimerase
VYGSVSLTSEQHQIAVREAALFTALNPYASQKYISEGVAYMFSNLYKMKIVAARPFNVFGEGQRADDDYATVIPKFAQQKADGKPLTVYGDGQQSRDFTYVTDVAEGMISAINEIKESNNDFDIVNLCAESPVTIKEVAEAFNSPIEFIDNPRKGEADWTYGEKKEWMNKSVDIIEWVKKNF